MDIVKLITQVFEVVLLVVNEIYTEKKLARERAERLLIDYTKMTQILERVTATFRQRAKLESDQAKKMEDAIDAAKRPRP